MHRFAYSIDKNNILKSKSLIKTRPFPFELKIYGFCIVNLCFSCRKPMVFDA